MKKKSLVFILGLVIVTLLIFFFLPKKTYELSYFSSPAGESYDVVVIGSDPEGIAAAYTSSKAGLRTLLIDFNREMIGGLYTLGELNMIDFNRPPENYHFFGKSTDFINAGFFKKFYRHIGKRQSFDIENAKYAFEQLLGEANTEVVMTEGKVSQITYDKIKKENTLSLLLKEKEKVLTAKVVIDATPNGDIAWMRGAKYYDGKEDLGYKGTYQAATLVYRLKNIDWEKVDEYLSSDNNDYTGLTDNAAWGYEIMTKCHIKNPRLQSRGLNLGRQNDGTVLVNALQVFNFNPYHREDDKIKKECISAIKNEIVPYMRQHCPGFENAEYVSVAPEFYVRESRHLIGEDTLTSGNVFDSVFEETFVASGSYPMDVQTSAKGEYGLSYQDNVIYGINGGVMVPKDIEGLFVVSKVASMDSIAYGSARTVPVLVSLAEASGAMAKLMIDKNLSTKEVLKKEYVKELHQILSDLGVKLKAYPNFYKHSYDTSYALEELKVLRDKGLIMTKEMSKSRFHKPILVGRLPAFLKYIEESTLFKAYPINRFDILEGVYKKTLYAIDLSKPITHDEILKISQKLLGKTMNSYDEMVTKGIMRQEVAKVLKERAKKSEYLSEEDFIAVMGSVIREMLAKNK